jgi:hypothetical protein
MDLIGVIIAVIVAGVLMNIVTKRMAEKEIEDIRTPFQNLVKGRKERTK